MSVLVALAGCQGEAVFVFPEGPGDVLFTEVMPELEPADGSWLELFNTLTRASILSNV